MDTKENTQARLRLLCGDDIAVFRQIRLEALRLDPDAFASSEADWTSMSDADWRRHLVESHILVAFRDDAPVGIMGLSRQRASKMHHRAMIVMVYVQQAERGSGTARALLDFLTRHARSIGVRQLELAVREDNQPARRFYLREGFCQIGQVPAGISQDGQDIDEILMARRIDGTDPSPLSNEKEHAP